MSNNIFSVPSFIETKEKAKKVQNLIFPSVSIALRKENK